MACHTNLPYAIAIPSIAGEPISCIQETVSPRSTPRNPVIRSIPLQKDRRMARLSWPSAIFFGEPEIRDSHFCQRALNISTSLHVPAWIDTERVELRGRSFTIWYH